jgi:hypothetical protein
MLYILILQTSPQIIAIISNVINKESQPQQAVGYSLSLQMGTDENRSKLRGIKPIWSNKVKVNVRQVVSSSIKDPKDISFIINRLLSHLWILFLK